MVKRKSMLAKMQMISEYYRAYRLFVSCLSFLMSVYLFKQLALTLWNKSCIYMYNVYKYYFASGMRNCQVLIQLILLSRKYSVRNSRTWRSNSSNSGKKHDQLDQSKSIEHPSNLYITCNIYYWVLENTVNSFSFE